MFVDKPQCPFVSYEIFPDKGPLAQCERTAAFSTQHERSWWQPERDFAGFETLAAERGSGARLATKDEVRELLKTSYGGGARFPGEDQWAAVVNADGTKDLI